MRVPKFASCAMVLSGLLAAAACDAADTRGTSERTVIANERGMYFGYPYSPGVDPFDPANTAWADIGADITLRHVEQLGKMRPDAIKGVHGLLQHFPKANTSSGRPYFPWNDFQALNDAEVAAGRTPLIMTATYQGKRRPVVFYGVSDSGGHDTAVDVANDTFLQFFVDVYLNQNLRIPDLQNFWMGFDNCEFSYGSYGVLDDDGKFVSTEAGGFKFDAPFPQNGEEYRDAILYAVQRIKALAPDVKFICNGGFADVPAIVGREEDDPIFAALDGLIMEDFLDPDNGLADPYGAWYVGRTFDRLWNVAKDKVQIFQPRLSGIDDASRLRTGLVGYVIFTGPNGFVGPIDATSTEADPSSLKKIRAKLGNATADPTFVKESNPDNDPFREGFRVYSRQFQNGIAYLNWSGATKTIALPADRAFADRKGKRITSLTLKYREGNYATYAAKSRASRQR